MREQENFLMNWASSRVAFHVMQGTGGLLRRELGDREGRPYMSRRIEVAFSGTHTHLKTCEQQDFRRVIKVDVTNMLVTDIDVYESE